MLHTMKFNFYILFAIVFLIVTWLFTGIFRDDEFYELSIFGKHRPTFKIYFYSPTKQSDLTLKDLSFTEQNEERAFQEFVIEQGQQYDSAPKLWYLPFILIQLTLSFMLFGIYRLKKTVNYKIWQLPIRFLINIFLTTILIVFILVLDKMVWSILLTGLIFLSNYCILLLLTTKQRIFATQNL